MAHTCPNTLGSGIKHGSHKLASGYVRGKESWKGRMVRFTKATSIPISSMGKESLRLQTATRKTGLSISVTLKQE